MVKGIGSAPGKVIISGEHSVVYGFPAIAASIGLRCYVSASDYSEGILIEAPDLSEGQLYHKEDIESLNKGITINNKLDNVALAAHQTLSDRDHNVKLKITSNIPVSAGLGSSAAVAVATIAAVSDFSDINLERSQISKIAFNAEKITHGNPSGIDNSIATYGGLLKFHRGDIVTKKLEKSIPLIIGNTQVIRNTKELVSGVAKLNKNYPELSSKIFQTMGLLTKLIDSALDKFDQSIDLQQLGPLMNVNQGLLDAIGVGHPSVSKLIWKARLAGAYGAKLTGAGGGGCMIAIAPDIDIAKHIAKELQENGISIISTELISDGVIIGSK